MTEGSGFDNDNGSYGMYDSDGSDELFALQRW